MKAAHVANRSGCGCGCSCGCGGSHNTDPHTANAGHGAGAGAGAGEAAAGSGSQAVCPTCFARMPSLQPPSPKQTTTATAVDGSAESSAAESLVADLMAVLGVDSGAAVLPRVQGLAYVERLLGVNRSSKWKCQCS